MSAFVKIYGSIIHSTVWAQKQHVKLTWITMLVLADVDGRVEASIPGLALQVGCTVPECEEALTLFLAPDKYSRTKDHDGRRIVELPEGGGWLILNHAKYRDMRSDRQKKAADRQRKYRDDIAKAAPKSASQRRRNTSSDIGDRSRGESTSRNVSRLSRADPDPDPDLIPKGISISCTADVQHTPTPRSEVEHPTIPVRSYVVPDAWQPLERHAARCIDLGLDLDEQVANYRTFEFERPLSDWNRRFDRWLTDGRKRAETEAFKRQQAARGGARRTVNGVAQLQPDGGLTGFEAVDRDD